MVLYLHRLAVRDREFGFRLIRYNAASYRGTGARLYRHTKSPVTWNLGAVIRDSVGKCP